MNPKMYVLLDNFTVYLDLVVLECEHGTFQYFSIIFITRLTQCLVGEF